MTAMTALLSLFGVLIISQLVTRVGATALRLTGMSHEAAEFQARSAFTGVGFTTEESEKVVTHPVRRRIVMQLMLLSHLGVGAVVATLMLSLTQASTRTGLLAFPAGLLILWLLARSTYVERWVNLVISWSLLRFGKIQACDYVALLQLEDGYSVSELLVESSDWLAERTLQQLRLGDEGVLVLGIRRENGVHLGTPQATTTVRKGDLLTLYGSIDRIAELDQRRRGERGDSAHERAIEAYVEDLAQHGETDVVVPY